MKKIIGYIVIFCLLFNGDFTAKALSNDTDFKDSEHTMYVKTMKQDILCLMMAYPEYIKDIVIEENENIYLVMQSGKKILYDDKKTKTFQEKMINPDIQDMMEQIYPLTPVKTLMNENFDPGRSRCYAVFTEVYGRSKSQIEANLTKVKVENGYYQFNGNNKAASSLQVVMREIISLGERKKDIMSFVFPINGTYNYRYIAGTNRLSPHAFGIAIDLVRNNADYWRWAPRDEGKKRLMSYPLELVELFEKNNFIWGGKWGHFDILHFEYRPEIILKARYFGHKADKEELWYGRVPYEDDSSKSYIDKIDKVLK